MKKIYLLIISLMLMVPMSVNASNKIHSIDIDIYLNEDGSANITETWDVDGTDGTEWYKVMNNLGNSKLSNFSVIMDGKNLTYKNWNIDESLIQKRGYYGINYTSDGLELCFGKYDYNRHVFVLNYSLSNFVFSTDDSQVIYFNLIDKLTDVDFDRFSVTVSSYYEFPDTLDVWGYGYEGYAYVSNGKIEMSDEDGDMNNDYVVLLAKFPLGTFTNKHNTVDDFKTFDEVLNKAEKGTFWSDFFNKVFIIIGEFIENILGILIFVFSVFGIKKALEDGYGYKNNKKIDKSNVPMFRDIPCNKDIYYANTLIKLNNFEYKQGNILGAIILKWLRNDKIIFKNEKKGVFNKDTSVIDLTKDVTFDNEMETKLFSMMRAASKDGLLETKEFEKWCKKNYDKFFNVFTRIENDTINSLKDSGHIWKRTDKNECKKKNVMDDMIYNDSVELYGLKKYLEEFSRMDTKEVMEVKLWDEYLMFAYLFGIADKVSKQLKDMYPEVIEEMHSQNFDYDTLLFVNHISLRSVSAASSARSAAQSYSSGGGGFSSSGGGGGSFGGGGGGSR
ncbi:MAG: DUF2207 domain-containing protein [Bacilli bacterium]|nr:DUF2207 domain-containing protein [Bacilli bacterium]